MSISTPAVGATHIAAPAVAGLAETKALYLAPHVSQASRDERVKVAAADALLRVIDRAADFSTAAHHSVEAVYRRWVAPMSSPFDEGYDVLLRGRIHELPSAAHAGKVLHTIATELATTHHRLPAEVAA